MSVLPEPFTRERADGKIPVKVELIRAQVQRELDGTPEGESEVARWQAIETDYNECRLSSARATKSEAEEVFAACMSRRGYVYMFPIDAEQFHNDIAFELEKERDTRRAAEKKRLAEYKKKYDGLDNDRLLILAALYGDSEIAKLLLSAGAHPSAADESGSTALIAAAQQGHAEVVNILLSAGAHPNYINRNGWTALKWAVQFGESEVVKILLSEGAEANQKGSSGITALDIAKREGFSEIVRILRAAGAR